MEIGLVVVDGDCQSRRHGWRSFVNGRDGNAIAGLMDDRCRLRCVLWHGQGGSHQPRDWRNQRKVRVVY